MDLKYFNNDHIFLVLQGYTLCFNLFEARITSDGGVEYITVKHDIKTPKNSYVYNSEANSNHGGYCIAVITSKPYSKSIVTDIFQNDILKNTNYEVEQISVVFIASEATAETYSIVELFFDFTPAGAVIYSSSITTTLIS